MYLALKPIKYRKADLTVGIIAAGEEVPDFENWDHFAKRGMLEQKWVRWSDTGELAPHERAAAERKVEQPLPRGPLGAPPGEPERQREAEFYKSAIPDLPELRGSVVDSEAPEEEPAANPLFKPAPAAKLDARVVVDTEPAPAGDIICGICQRAGFKDQNGLRIHQARVHKDIV